MGVIVMSRFSVLAILLLLPLALTACPSGSSSKKDPYIGKYHFRFVVDGQTYQDNYNVDTKTEELNSDGEPFYRGTSLDDPNYLLALANYPSTGSIIAATNDPYGTGYSLSYVFNFSGSNLEGLMCVYDIARRDIVGCVDLINSTKDFSGDLQGTGATGLQSLSSGVGLDAAAAEAVRELVDRH